jgi:hypothetical protein
MAKRRLILPDLYTSMAGGPRNRGVRLIRRYSESIVRYGNSCSFTHSRAGAAVKALGVALAITMHLRLLGLSLLACPRSPAGNLAPQLTRIDDYVLKIDLDYVTKYIVEDLHPGSGGDVSGDDLQTERQEWRLAAAARTAPREVRDPVRRAAWPGCGQAAAGPRCHYRCGRRGSPTENRHGGAPRGVPVAPGHGGRASHARQN